MIKKLMEVVASVRTWMVSSQRTSWVPKKVAGIRVTHDNALTFSAVFACVRIISETIASMPWRLHRELPNGKGNVLVSGDPIDSLLHKQANLEISAFDFRSTIIAWALTWGNGYAEIVRNGLGRVVALELLPPDIVDPFRSDGVLWYRVRQEGGPLKVVERHNMFHLHGLGWDGSTGYSVISLAAKTIGLGLAAELWGSSYFENSTKVGAIFRVPETLTEDAFTRLKASIKEKLSGPRKAHQPILLEAGAEIVYPTLPAEDAQFLQTRKMQIEEVARWYRVPLNKLANLDRQTFNNIEHEGTAFVNDTLVPWVRRLESEANIKLVPLQRRSTHYTKIHLQALLRGDTQARGEFYKTMSTIGAFSINDVLKFEDMNPVPNGDQRLVQVNMTTLEALIEKAKKEADAPVSPRPTIMPLPDDEDGEELRRDATNRLRDMAETERRLILNADDAARDRDDFEGRMLRISREQRKVFAAKFVVVFDALAMGAGRIGGSQRMLEQAAEAYSEVLQAHVMQARDSGQLREYLDASLRSRCVLNAVEIIDNVRAKLRPQED